MTMFGSQWLANAGSTYEIDQSIRFNDDDSPYLTRTPGSGATDNRKFTVSMWLKRTSLTVDHVLFSTPTGNGRTQTYFDDSDKLNFGFFDGADNRSLVTNMQFRDTAAWYHVVWSFDIDNGTAANRLRLYVNGSEAAGTRNNPNTGVDSLWMNNGDVNDIGRQNPSTSAYFDGYMAEIHSIDGQALDGTSFGETNDDGVWIPKKYSGAYGTNGFFIDGRDSSDLGDDESGNGNDFASSGLAAADQMPDTPTLNHWTLNFLDSGSGLANGNLQDLGGDSTHTHSPGFPITGKWYWEIVCTDINTGSVGAHFFAITDASVAYSAGFTAAATISAGTQRGGQLKKNNSNTSTGTAIGDGDIVGMAFDADNLTLDILVNNSASGSQITGLTASRYKIWIQNGAAVTNMTFNFAEASFEYTPPTGFKSLNTSNMPTPTIKDGTKYFQTTLYEGDGSTQSIDQSGNSTFQPDWVWIKNMDAGDSHVLTDSPRGVTKILSTNNTDAETTDADTVTAFESDGFALGADVKVNTSGESYVAWQWHTQGAAGSSNTDGSINTTTTSLNATAGLSISTYTGTGSNATVGHGLGVAPSMIIAHRRDGTGSWRVYNKNLTDASYVLNMESTDAQGVSATVWNSTAPTSTVFSIGTNSEVNASSGTFVAYCFAEIEGYSQFGSYVANAAANGPFIYTGFKPAFIIFKCITATRTYVMYDNARDPFNVVNDRLFPNTADPNDPHASNDHVDFLSNGFKMRSAGTLLNAAGTYIFMAFAENPFGGDGAAPGTAR
mgnify:CR=1 FL=1